MVKTGNDPYSMTIIRNCQEAWKKSKLDWIDCRIYKKCGYEDFILDIYNTCCEIIHIKV